MGCLLGAIHQLMPQSSTNKKDAHPGVTARPGRTRAESGKDPMSHRTHLRLASLTLVLVAAASADTVGADSPPPGRVLTGRDALGDWTTDAPGMRRKITEKDL